MLLRFHGVGAGPEQIHHRFSAATIGIPEMQGARPQGALTPDHMGAARLYAAAGDRRPAQWCFLIIVKISYDKALVQSPLSSRPALMTRAELEAVRNGHLVLMTRRAGLVDLSRRQPSLLPAPWS
jgi:ATP-binding cassette, subfamily B, bacterial HlyB/CyaB